MTHPPDLSTAPPAGRAEAIALARKAPLTRGAVRELAKRLTPELARDAAVAALDVAGANAAMVLAFAAAASGAKLPPALTRALLPEVASLDHVGPLVLATEGPALDVLVAFLEDERGDLELECLAALLAAEALVDSQTAPVRLLTRARWLARHKLAGDASLYLGAAASRIKDPELSALAAPHVNRARRAKRTIDDALAAARLGPLDALDDADGSRVSTGFTVRHEAPAVGRNDPCPCGSGKKYKKCHALAEATTAAAEPARIDAATLGPDQAALLRPSEIASLDTSRLSPKAFVEAFRRVVDFRRWDLALEMIRQARARRDLGREGEAAVLVLDALHGAYGAGAREAAEQLFALLPTEDAAREAFAIECVRAPADLLARIEGEAEDALRTDADGARGMRFASALLRWFPALGIYVARGALHEGRTRDSQALLQGIEDARDRLLLSPFEAWWDVYDAFFESADERRAQKEDDARREKMKEDLRRARAAARKTAAELEKLQARMSELDQTLVGDRRGPAEGATSDRSPGPQSARATKKAAEVGAPSADLVEERRRLKTKIEELQRIIGEGQEERRELRQKLADREEDEPQAPARPPRPDEPDLDVDARDDAGSVDLPRGVLVPRFSERASKAVTELAADAADGVLGVVSALAAGKPNAWGGVKQLTKVRGVLSARAGIHHRVLFSVEDRSLEILEVLHRRDLEQVVARLARTS